MSKKVKTDRLFVPLSKKPFEWFLNEGKRWELRRYKGQYNEKNVLVGRVVELRLGYNSSQSIWGKIIDVVVQNSLEQIYHQIKFNDILPSVRDKKEAITLSNQILNKDTEFYGQFIAFKIDKNIPVITLNEKYFTSVLDGNKHSTVRLGKRNYQLGGAVLDFYDKGKIPIYITNIEHKSISELNNNDARKDGFDSKATLLKELALYYSKIQQRDYVTIINFEKEMSR